MNDTKPILSSKTVLANLALALLSALVFFGLVPGLDNDLLEGSAFNEIVGAIGVIGNLAAAYFRKTATAQLVSRR